MRKEHFEKDNKRSDKRVPQVVNLHRAGPLRVPVSLPFSACGSSSTARVRCGSQIQLNFQLAGSQSSPRGSAAGPRFNSIFSSLVLNLHRAGPPRAPIFILESSIFTARVRCGDSRVPGPHPAGPTRVRNMWNLKLAGPQSRPRGSVSAPDPHPAGPTRVRILTARVRTPRLHFIRLRGGGEGGGRGKGG